MHADGPVQEVVGFDDGENVTVYDAVFYTGTINRGSYVYDTIPAEQIVPLGEVPGRYYSEIVHQLTRNLKDSQIQDSAFAPYFVDHTTGVYPTAASGFPWTAASMAVKGDPIADLTEDLAAEQKARVTYDNILRLSDDPDVNDVIKFLREREIVHFQRFGEALEHAREKMNQKNVYLTNPAFDK